MTFRLPYAVHSSDCHVVEPPELWTERIDRRFRDRAPRVVRVEDTDLWVVDDSRRMAVVGIQAQAGYRFDDREITKRGRYAEIGEISPQRVVADLDTDGVGFAVMFGSNAHQAYRVVDDPALLSAIFQTFNDWMLEYCAGEPRLRGVTVINIDDVSEGIAELERTVAVGACAAMIPILPRRGRRYDQPIYEPLWAAAENLGVPLVFHVGANQAVVGREPVIDLVRHGMKDLHVRSSIATMVLSGVFARHPRLRMGVVEFEASWAPYMMEQMDALYTSGRGRALAKLPDGELPSDHHHRGVFINFQEDPACIVMRDAIGVDNLCWGNDYPHAESTFPRSHALLAEQLEGIPEEDARKIAGENMVRLFGFPTEGFNATQSPLPPRW